MDVAKYFHTIRYLTPVQLFYQVYYKIRAKVRKYTGYKHDLSLYKEGKPLQPKATWIEKSTSYKGENLFEFLNVPHHFTGHWDDSSQGDLWRYNLNYMDFLLQSSMTVEEGYSWIDRYINSTTDNKIAWDPYPISLRGINWIKFVSLHHNELSKEQLQRIDTALYSQYSSLMSSTERHLMANHYLENGFSLLFAALYFDDSDFYKAAEKILYSQLEEQILEDGAHFELSPMYHCVILERMLDCYNVIDAQRLKSLSDDLLEKTKKMSGWLRTIVMTDGSIPLLNDAALEVAPSPHQLFHYAQSLGIDHNNVVLTDSGYRKWAKKSYEVIADVAALGPSYNLGHSHADTFTFIMHIDGKPFIVDTGTSTYTAGQRRSYERSTKAHNTVCVDNMNSSQVWGAFRCAKRASVTLIEETADKVKASHDGYASLGVKCTREFISCDDRFIITDIVEGRCPSEAAARLYLSPEIADVEVHKDSVVTPQADIIIEGATGISLEKVEVSTHYNVLQPSICICISFSSKLTTSIVPNQK